MVDGDGHLPGGAAGDGEVFGGGRRFGELPVLGGIDGAPAFLDLLKKRSASMTDAPPKPAVRHFPVGKLFRRR